MSRIARIVLPGIPYHVTQRGNGRQRVFFTETDYVLYLDLLREHAAEAGLVLWAYCLMPNHIHLVAVPTKAEALAQALGRTHANFARKKNRASGMLWRLRSRLECQLRFPRTRDPRRDAS